MPLPGAGGSRRFPARGNPEPVARATLYLTGRAVQVGAAATSTDLRTNPERYCVVCETGTDNCVMYDTARAPETIDMRQFVDLRTARR
jgi:hypothetical protein